MVFEKDAMLRVRISSALEGAIDEAAKKQKLSTPDWIRAVLARAVDKGAFGNWKPVAPQKNVHSLGQEFPIIERRLFANQAEGSIRLASNSRKSIRQFPLQDWNGACGLRTEFSQHDDCGNSFSRGGVRSFEFADC